MSASLVGSEMCIRDRVIAPACVCGRERQPGLAPVEQRVGAFRLSSGAVSYTHLTLPTICSV
eukprot:13073747-Alexandrium_andersonii.AAC.1